METPSPKKKAARVSSVALMSAPLTEDLPSDSSYEYDEEDSDDEDDDDINNSSDHSVSDSINAEDISQDDELDFPLSGKRSSVTSDIQSPPAVRQRLADDEDPDSTALSRKARTSPRRTNSCSSSSSDPLLLSPPRSPHPVQSPVKLTPSRRFISSLRKTQTSTSPKPHSAPEDFNLLQVNPPQSYCPISPVQAYSDCY